MVFRRDTKVDAFQRQISALRQQLGAGEDEERPLESSSYDDPPVESSSESTPQLERTYAEVDAPVADQSDRGYAFGQMSSPPRDESRVPQVVATAPEIPSLPTPLGEGTTSVVAHDTVWNGELQSNGSVHIHGRAVGSISTKEDIFIAEGADVEASIHANSVMVAGVVRGTIRCLTRFEALPQGRIASDIHAPTVVVHEGAIITGQFRMEAGASEPPVDKPAQALVQRRAARGG